MTASPVTTSPPPSDSAPGDAADRGDLRISDRVVEKIAALAAASVPEVGGPPRRTIVGASSGRRKAVPVVAADVRGGGARLSMTMSVRYPASVPDVVAAVREKVRTDVGALTGLRVAHLDVEVPALSPRRPARRR